MDTSDLLRVSAFSLWAKTATFSPCGCDEVGLDALRRLLSERAAESERLIIRMSQNAQQLKGRSQSVLRKVNVTFC